MQSTSGWLLVAVVAGLMVGSHARREYCPSSMRLALGLPDHRNLTIHMLADEAVRLSKSCQAVDKINEKSCVNKTKLKDACFPLGYVQCEDERSACAIYEAMGISESWLDSVGHRVLVCRMERARSRFKDYLIRSVFCKSLNVAVIKVYTTLEEKCLMLEVLNKLAEYLYEYLGIPNPSRVSHTSVP